MPQRLNAIYTPIFYVVLTFMLSVQLLSSPNHRPYVQYVGIESYGPTMAKAFLFFLFFVGIEPYEPTMTKA